MSLLIICFDYCQGMIDHILCVYLMLSIDDLSSIYRMHWVDATVDN